MDPEEVAEKYQSKISSLIFLKFLLEDQISLSYIDVDDENKICTKKNCHVQ